MISFFNLLSWPVPEKNGLDRQGDKKVKLYGFRFLTWYSQPFLRKKVLTNKRTTEMFLFSLLRNRTLKIEFMCFCFAFFSLSLKDGCSAICSFPQWFFITNKLLRVALYYEHQEEFMEDLFFSCYFRENTVCGSLNNIKRSIRMYRYPVINLKNLIIVATAVVIAVIIKSSNNFLCNKNNYN